MMKINLSPAWFSAVRFVKGHGFSRAANAAKERVGFSPCGMLAIHNYSFRLNRVDCRG
jgi:hypothetical protein